MKFLNDSVALSATLHCLTGCAIGEILGLIIGTALGFSSVSTVVLAVSLAFFFGYLLSLLPLLKSGLTLRAAFSVAFAADTASIAVMETVDNGVMLMIPGAMDVGLVHPLFWLSLAFALAAAFLVALPLNSYLIKRGKGHALAHQHHNHQGHMH